jgi:thiol-disulfide isomerase/thioredoxin
VGFSLAQRLSDEDDWCGEGRAAAERVDAVDARARYEALRVLRSGECDDLDKEAIDTELAELAKVSKDRVVTSFGVYLSVQDGISADEVEAVVGVIESVPSRGPGMVRAAFAEGVDKKDPSIRAVRAAIDARLVALVSSEVLSDLQYGSSMAASSGDEKLQKKLLARLDELDPTPDREGPAMSDLTRAIYDANKRPTHESGLEDLDKLARRMPEKGAERALWQKLRMSRLQHLGRADDVYAALKDAVRADPSDGLTVNNFAYEAALRGEDLREALEAIEAALPQLEERSLEGRWWTAQTWSDSARNERSNWEDTRGWLLHLLGRSDEAVTALRYACELAGGPVSQAHLGLALVATDQSEEAFPWLAAAHEGADQLADEPALLAESRVALEALWPQRGIFHHNGLDGWLQSRIDAKIDVAAPEDDGETDPLAGGSGHRMIGQDWPIPTGELLAGGVLDIKPEPGGLLVVDMWATWCGPCVAGMPHLQEVAERYAERNVKVVGLSVDAQENAVKKFYKGVEQPDYALAHIGKSGMETLQISGIPALFLVGSDGKILHFIRGYSEGDARLEHALDHFLDGAPVVVD